MKISFAILLHVNNLLIQILIPISELHNLLLTHTSGQIWPFYQFFRWYFSALGNFKVFVKTVIVLGLDINVINTIDFLQFFYFKILGLEFTSFGDVFMVVHGLI
jgi:hypothetical protein